MEAKGRATGDSIKWNLRKFWLTGLGRCKFGLRPPPSGKASHAALRGTKKGMPLRGNMFSIADLLRTPEDAPPSMGAYVLLIELAAPVPVTLPGKPSTTLEASRCLYCGSAKGPGGIRARLAWHMRVSKKLQWHVDRLTEAGIVTGAWVFPGGDECKLVRTLSHLPVPIPGFGSADCPRCRSHLLRWPCGSRL
jgi:Uri superfamily endonuclease